MDIDFGLVTTVYRLQGLLNTLHVLRQLYHLPLRESLLSFDVPNRIAETDHVSALSAILRIAVKALAEKKLVKVL